MNNDEMLLDEAINSIISNNLEFSEFSESNNSSLGDNTNDSYQMLSVESDENEEDIQKQKQSSKAPSNANKQSKERQNTAKNAQNSKKTASDVGTKTPKSRELQKQSKRDIMTLYDAQRKAEGKNKNYQQPINSTPKSDSTRINTTITQQPNQEILSKTQKMKNYFNELKDTQKILLTYPKTPDEFDKVITGSKIYQQVQKLDLQAIEYIKNKQPLPPKLKDQLNQYHNRLRYVYCAVNKRMSFIERNEKVQKLTQHNKSKQGGRY